MERRTPVRKPNTSDLLSWSETPPPPPHHSQTPPNTGRIAQISFSADGNVSPKKPTTLTEVAKQRKLSGNLLTEAELKSKKQISSAKMEEISGHNIFGPPTEIQPPRSLAAAQQKARRGNRDMGEPAPRNLRTSVKVSNPAGGQSNILFSEEPEVKTSKKIHDQKFQEVTGNGIFKGDE
ncbi:BnaC07g51350D [Brassica napus]|uniref:BnaC07g51350D protein n=1 Tax=Brassica napus TaxID=3708 RepID=A0A078J9N4_BRANA|nr:BnaC07g51350D [Brassica napus]